MSESLEPTAARPSGGLLDSYRPAPGGYDELLGPDGLPRPHWNKFVELIHRFEPEDMAGRWDDARRILREHGVTYNVYGDPRGMDRPWELDLVPLLIPSDEWRRIEAGLSQRARLLNLILADLYGPQRLLQEGWLPPEAVFANPGFLRPCHGLTPARGIHLFLHAIDLARSADGTWWALSDRTQAPSGMGYALENRIVISRVLPEEFRDCQVQRLASFFSTVRDTLRRVAPLHRDHPNIVLLTPGPYNETFFEHAYLARYLGFTLVEGGDLTVRDRRVYIKTLEGLQPVDVILRRVDDSFCDPLELRGDSFLGVPGLVEAVRAGQVTVANALGAGLVETPSLLAFLPRLCRQLLGEDLKIPSVATWWCGQDRELAHVASHLDEIVVKRAFGFGEPVFGERLDPEERASLLDRLRAAPHEFVGQEQVALSTGPVGTGPRLEPRPMVLRAYVGATLDGYTVMPGGLTRVSTSAQRPVVSMQSGGGSKDTWVLSEGPVSMVTLLKTTDQPVRLERAAAEVPSRVADNLFWLGRYVERLEGTARLLRSVLVRLVDESATETAPELLGLVGMLIELELLPAAVHERFPLAQLEKCMLSLVYRQHQTGSVRDLLNRLRLIAAVGRDRFSADTWRIFNRLHHDGRARPGRLPMADGLALLNTLIVDLAAFSGLEMENMTRGHGWRFLDIGRRLERSIHLLALVRAAIAAQHQGASALEPLLEVADSVMTYRRRYFAAAQLPTVLDLLLLDDTNPRSLAFQLHALAEHSLDLPAERARSDALEEQRQIALVTSTLNEADIHALAQKSGGATGPLDDLLVRLSDDLGAVSDTITHHYFSHVRVQMSGG